MRLSLRRQHYRCTPVSIHAPWEGCDQAEVQGLGIPDGFNSRTLGRVRQYLSWGKAAVQRVSIHAPWEGCDSGLTYESASERVSIHAPWEGCDSVQRGCGALIERFNSRTLGRVRRPCCPLLDYTTKVFQFTHPGKGATGLQIDKTKRPRRFNSRTLGRVRQCGAKLRIIGRINKRNLRLGVLS